MIRYFVILFGNLSASPNSNSWGELSGGQYLQEANMIPTPTFSANNQGFHPSKVFIFELKIDKQFFSIFISWYRIKATYFSAHQSDSSECQARAHNKYWVPTEHYKSMKNHLIYGFIGVFVYNERKALNYKQLLYKFNYLFLLILSFTLDISSWSIASTWECSRFN